MADKDAAAQQARAKESAEVAQKLAELLSVMPPRPTTERPGIHFTDSFGHRHEIAHAPQQPRRVR